ncbi:LuxR C-terminal-related transcriptional regulator [Gordonia rhizosphera]|uniref:Putative LuxR family transcriptional regulator n=1 Tax=Gordonia rhizosphera NBRC 16068 TaxID=1108045 RepID=K6VR68_9ACTN|nr:LuxR C-terminal-related transcriptional regulator [Gordonia rhizosphera]GAB89385.1 putative LuxR family transcriptional regulator [Gordonia rhizosphera NBRC 16068]
MGTNLALRTRDGIARVSQRGLDWVGFCSAVGHELSRVIAYERSCWHTVDPGTVLFTGSMNCRIECSGSWLAYHEYVVEDVDKWSFLAHSGRLAGALSIDTHGDLTRSVRHRSHAAYGIGDELRVSFVSNGTYWGAAAFLRDADQPWFTDDDVRTIAWLAAPIADGLRRAMLNRIAATSTRLDHGPGVVVFDENGEAESVSPAAERWIAEMVEIPTPTTAIESKTVQSVAARARAIAPGTDPVELAARSRVCTRSGTWLLLYGTRLSGAVERTAVIIQPATPNDVAPIIALAYGLSQRETQVTLLCIQGRSTRDIAHTLSVSPYTVQDHLKSIFAKTGVRSRGELVGQVFLEHYAPRWEPLAGAPSGWSVNAIVD